MAGKKTVDLASGIAEVDAILAGVGLTHGRRTSRKGTWKGGERVGVGTGALRAAALGKAAGAKRGSAGVELVLDRERLGWEKVDWLRAGFSTRLGGVSTVYTGGEGPGELNLGWTAQDDPALVAENRRRLRKAVGAAKMELVALRQVHSGVVRVIEAGNRGQGAADRKLHAAGSGYATAEGKAVLSGDGVMTDVPGLLLGVQVADCVPVIVVDKKRKVVAVFHAGWRGTLKRIVERGVGTMRLRYGSRPEDLLAAVGPSIGPCCYAVGEEVRHEFESQFAYAQELFSEVYDSDPVREKYPLLFLTARAPGHSPIGPQMHVDLWEANRRQLLDAGLKAKHVTVLGECSACARVKGGGRKYFSHRAEHGFAGRMMGVAGISV